MVTLYHVRDFECSAPTNPAEEEDVPLFLLKKGRNKMYDLWVVSRRDKTNRVLLVGNIQAKQIPGEIEKARTIWRPEDFYICRTRHKSDKEII